MVLDEQHYYSLKKKAAIGNPIAALIINLN